MTEIGKKLIETWYNQFRSDYLADHDRANENDVERAFLKALLARVKEINAAGKDDLKTINSIR